MAEFTNAQKTFAAHFYSALERQSLRAVLVGGEPNDDSAALTLIKIGSGRRGLLRTLGIAAYHKSGRVVVESHANVAGESHKHSAPFCVGAALNRSPQGLYGPELGQAQAPDGMRIFGLGNACMKLACDVAYDMATKPAGYMLETMLPPTPERVLSLGEPPQLFADPALQAAMGVIREQALTAQNSRPRAIFDV